MNSKDQVYIFHMQNMRMLRFEKSFSDAVRDPEGDVTRKTGSERYDLNRFASYIVTAKVRQCHRLVLHVILYFGGEGNILGSPR